MSHVEKFPYLDMDRTAFAGGSYGGYLASWIFGHDLATKVRDPDPYPLSFPLPNPLTPTLAVPLRHLARRHHIPPRVHPISRLPGVTDSLLRPSRPLVGLGPAHQVGSGTPGSPQKLASRPAHAHHPQPERFQVPCH